jgi:hypothetical protein
MPFDQDYSAFGPQPSPVAMRISVIFFLFFIQLTATAQQTIRVNLPDAAITAGRVTRGDADTYGLGDWRCTFTATLEGLYLRLDGVITFTEKANDFTTITGEYHRRIYVRELEKCQSCNLYIPGASGTVSGPNIGARGYRWFNGQGMVRRARIQTDVFGADAGQIGGVVQFAPVLISVKCLYAGQ